MSAKKLLVSIAFFVVLANILASLVKLPIHDSKNAGYGSYGVCRAQFIDDLTGDPKVFFMGNSVYHGTEVIPAINQIQRVKVNKIQAGNFGFTGASVYDYIHNYELIRTYKPDLVVVQFNPTSFGYNGPYYRNDGKNQIFRPSNIHLLENKFLRETYTKDDYAMALCHSVFPLARVIKIYKTNFRNALRNSIKKWTNLQLWRFIPNRINAAGEWRTNKANNQAKIDLVDERHLIDEKGQKTKQYITAESAFRYFANQLEQDNQLALFIIQPSGFPRLPLLDNMESILREYKSISFSDHHDFFNPELYIDKVHPDKVGAKLDAERHYRLITQILKL